MRYFCVLLCVCFLSACGQYGRLYLPNTPPPAPTEMAQT